VHADALAALRDSQERGTETTMQGFGVTLSWFLGDAEGALEFARKQLLMAEEIRVPTLRAGAFDSMAVALMMSGRFGEALDYSQKALSTARDSGTLLQSEAVFLSNLCAAYAGIGDIDKSIAVGEEAVESARNRRTPMFEIRARLHLARALLDVDPARAEETLHVALDLVEQTDARGYEPFLREELARTYHRRGDDASCGRETAAALRLFDSNGAPSQFERVGREPDLCHESSDTPTIH
jgi:ATP/maltotriose-dependent transcriptional regulator MalT